jgi:hypothetical protein
VAARRFTTRVSVTNTGAVVVPGGRLTFALPAAQRLIVGAPGVW